MPRSLPRLAEFTGLEGSNPRHAVQDETACRIAFVGKPGACAFGNQCGSAIVTARNGTNICSMHCNEQTLRVTQASTQLLNELVDCADGVRPVTLRRNQRHPESQLLRSSADLAIAFGRSGPKPRR
jgi:hypothetical protein